MIDNTNVSFIYIISNSIKNYFVYDSLPKF